MFIQITPEGYTQDGDEKARVNQHNTDVLTALLERAK